MQNKFHIICDSWAKAQKKNLLLKPEFHLTAGVIVQLHLDKDTGQHLKYSTIPLNNLPYVPSEKQEVVTAQFAVQQDVEYSSFVHYLPNLTDDSNKLVSFQVDEKWNKARGEQDWVNFIKNSSSYPPNELFCFSPTQKEFFVLPIPLLSIPVAFLLFPREEATEADLIKISKFIEQSSREMEYYYLASHAFVYLTIISEEPPASEQELVENFGRHICDALLPTKYRIGESEWINSCSVFNGSNVSLRLNLLDSCEVDFQLTICSLPHQDRSKLYHKELEWRLERLKYSLQSIFNLIHDSWLLKSTQNQGVDLKLNKLAMQLDAYQGVLKEVVLFHNRHEKQVQEIKTIADKLINPSMPSKFEFYKESTSWRIRYDGELVKAGKFEKGLSYIHKMLQNPDRKFYPNELDIIGSGGDKGDKNFYVNASTSLAIRVHSQFSEISPNDEKSLKNALESLYRNAPDDLDSLEQRIDYLSQVVYLANSLKNSRSTSVYIDLYNEYSQKLEDTTEEFIDKHDDELYVKRVLDRSKVIIKTAELNKSRRRLHQRVIKNMQNALNSLNSDKLKAYFNETLTLRVPSYFTPKPSKPIPWKLQMDE